MGELMDATASNFSNRSNAKRAAEKMIAKGTASVVALERPPSLLWSASWRRPSFLP